MKYVSLISLACVVALASLISSCATSETITGSPIDPALVGKIVDGQTTEQQIITWFGAPTTTSELGENVLYVYKYCKTSGSGLYTGYFGQTKSVEKCNELTVTFDKATGVVRAHNFQKRLR